MIVPMNDSMNDCSDSGSDSLMIIDSMMITCMINYNHELLWVRRTKWRMGATNQFESTGIH